MFFLFLLLLLIALVLEGSVTTLPLVFLVLLCWSIVRQDRRVFVAAFITGILLDVMTLRLLGVSSLFFVVALFLVLLYQRKYEIMSYPFVFAAAFLGSLIYLALFVGNDVLLQSFISALSSLVVFAIVSFRRQRDDDGKML